MPFFLHDFQTKIGAPKQHSSEKRGKCVRRTSMLINLASLLSLPTCNDSTANCSLRNAVLVLVNILWLKSSPSFRSSLHTNPSINFSTYPTKYRYISKFEHTKQVKRGLWCDFSELEALYCRQWISVRWNTRMESHSSLKSNHLLISTTIKRSLTSSFWFIHSFIPLLFFFDFCSILLCAHKLWVDTKNFEISYFRGLWILCFIFRTNLPK